MKGEWKITNIEGIEVTYKEFRGVGNNRYEITFVVNKAWKTHTLICLPTQLEYRMKEIVNIQKGLEGVK